MKGFIHYIRGHQKSESQAKQAYESFRKYNWNVELVEGITPKTLDESEFDYSLIEGGRLHGMRNNGDKKYYVKKSCISNQIRIWRKSVEENIPMAFIEHDAICVSNFNYKVDELLCLNLDYAFRPPSVLGTISGLKTYTPPSVISPSPLPDNYPLLYYKNNCYKGSKMIPGTAAYVVSPKGAEKLLEAAEKYGIDQSDFFINSMNVKIDYITPSPVKFNSINLNTSHGF